MEKNEVYDKYDKVKRVIKSCDNEAQLRVAVKLFNIFLTKYGHEVDDHYLHVLKELIGLMRIKCLEEEVNEQTSNIGKEFKTQLNLSGIKDLQALSPQMKEEINIGTQIEGNHLEPNDAQQLATHNVGEISDYYSNPNYCIIAVENKNGDKKTLRVEKELYEKSKEGEEQLLLADMEIFHENLDMNDITQSLRDQLKKKNSRKYSKDEIYNEINRRREEELKRRDKETQDWGSLFDEEEIEEATGAGSAGAYVGPMSRDIVRRKIKTDIPVSVNGVVGKTKMNKPIGKLYSFDVLEEDEDLEEAVDYGGAVGAYATPQMWAKNKKNWRGAHKLTYPGGKFVNIKKKCSTHPYCNQGWGGPGGPPITLSDTSDMKIDNVFSENKRVKKRHLKIKK